MLECKPLATPIELEKKYSTYENSTPIDKSIY